MYAVQRTRELGLDVAEFTVTAGAATAVVGETLRAPAGTPIELSITVEASDGRGHDVRVAVIGNGRLRALERGATPLRDRASRGVRRHAARAPRRGARARSTGADQPDLRAPVTTVAIHQPHYLPWLGYLAKWAAADVFVFLDTVQYAKNGWQNRNRIKTATGPRWLTVPVHAKLGMRIDDGDGGQRPALARPAPSGHRARLRAARRTWRAIATSSIASMTEPWERLAPLALASAEWLARTIGVTPPARLGLERSARCRPTHRAVGRHLPRGGCRHLSGRARRRAVHGSGALRGRRDRGALPGSTRTPCMPSCTGNSLRFFRALTYY